MSLKELSKNLQTEDEFHTFVKKERVIRRTLGFKNHHEKMSDIIRSHKHEEERKTNLKCFQTDWHLHDQYRSINNIAVKAIDLAININMVDQKGNIEKYWVYDCWGAIYEQNDYAKPHTHGPALWSFCYYIKIPEHSPPLYFPQAKLKVFPKPDEMIMFPGHVIHEVPKATEMIGERIVVAGNVYLDYRGLKSNT